MYRLTEAGMPTDPSYPSSLKQLGYFIDDKSEIRTIRPPHHYYNFWLSNNDRVNESFREAMHACINGEIIRRMTALGIPPVYLPQLTSEKPQDEASVPILVTNKEDLRKKKRIIVIINDDTQDLGMWAYRIVSKDHGLEAGSVVSLAKAMQTNQFASPPEADNADSKPDANGEKHALKESLITKPGAGTGPDSPLASKTPVSSTDDVPFTVPEDWKTPGLVVLNPGQAYYSHRLNKAMTKQSWDSQPRKTAIHPIPRIDPVYNTIEGSRSVDEHVKTSFDKILNNPEWVAPDANIYLVGIGNGGDAMLRVLSKEWSLYRERVAAMVLADPTPVHELFEDNDFVAFLRQRCRALVPSSEPFSTPVAVPFATDHPTDVEQHKGSNEFAKSQESTTSPAAPWLEDISDATGSDVLTSYISHLAIDSIVKSPTEPFQVTPNYSSEWGYHYYPILSSGERIFGELIFPFGQRAILAWFETVAKTPQYRNPAFKVPEPKPEGVEDEQIYDATNVPEAEPEGPEVAPLSDATNVPWENA